MKKIFYHQSPIKNHIFSKEKKEYLKKWLSPRVRELRYSLHLLRQSPLTIVGTAIILILVFVALLAPFISPFGPEEHIWSENKEPPSGKHFFGTDETGGDVFTKVMWGARISIEIGLIVVLGGLGVGILLGAFAGYYGGYIDEIVMRITDVFLSVPYLILAMGVAAILGKSIENVMIAMIVVWWPAYTRLVRGQILCVRENQYVEAARSVGAGDIRIIFRHILPNSMAPLIVQTTMDLGNAILTAAALSFLGFGAGPGTAEWGRMVSDSRSYFMNYPWMMVFPGLAIFITVLGFNLLGDGLRDILDPRLRRGGGKT
jgi:peptide/nickel transport system permease protein